MAGGKRLRAHTWGVDWGGCDGKWSEALPGIYNRTMAGVGVGVGVVGWGVGVVVGGGMAGAQKPGVVVQTWNPSP